MDTWILSDTFTQAVLRIQVLQVLQLFAQKAAILAILVCAILAKEQYPNAIPDTALYPCASRIALAIASPLQDA